MDRETIINYDKGSFMKFLEEDTEGKILEVLNDEGIELLKKYKYTEERITYMLCYSKYINELFNNNKFLDLFLNTDINYYYASLHSLDKSSYKKIIDRCIELNKDNYFIGELFSYFNKDYKLNTIENWPYSSDLLYEIFKKDLSVLGPKIMKSHDIDLDSHNISMEYVFRIGRILALKEMEYRNIRHEKTDVLYIPSDKITKNIIENLWNKSDVFKYRRIINNATYCSDPTKLNEYAKLKEDNLIKNSDNSLIKEYEQIYNMIIKLYNCEDDSVEFYQTRNKLNKLIRINELYELSEKIPQGNIEEIKNYLEKLSNQIISNYIIDYHFEENYYNIMYDLRELLNFYYGGNINIPEERLSLYNKLAHIDEISNEDKKELHEQLKKHNMIELFYDDMFYARKIVREAIKDYSLTKEMMEEYKDEKLSREYGIDVYNIKNNPFFAVVKSGRAAPDNLPTGHSYSLIGNGCIGVIEDPCESTTFVYDSENLNSDQIVHVYPMDSFTCYKPFSYEEKATNRIQTLMMPDELLKETTGYNEILILEQGREVTDIDKKVPELKKMALYCLDKITKKDIEVAESHGVGIFLINSKDYNKGYDMPSNIYRHNNIESDYWNYSYYNGTFNEEKHQKNR